MKKMFVTSFLVLLFILLSGCSNLKETTRQGAYYDGGTNDANIVYGPIFTKYEGCKSWAIDMASNAFNNYAFCAKNCHDSVAGTPICEDVVRTWQPLPGSNTFDNYKK